MEAATSQNGTSTAGGNPQPDATDAFKDPESADIELKICKEINSMPASVRDRFKAVKVLFD